MPVSVTLPALGESVTEGTVTRWLKQPGDTVEVDEPLLEVSTDKVDTEIPSPAAGTLLEVKVNEDETVEVGAELATIGDESEAGQGGGDDKSGGGEQEAGEEEAGEEDQAEQAAAESSGLEHDTEKQQDTAREAPPEQPKQPKQAEEPTSKDSGGSGETTPVTLPELGESVTEGTITRWLKQPGDKVEVDEALLEVSTDKVDTEIPSPVAGVLVEIKVNEDETVEVGAVLATVGPEGAAPAGKDDAGAPAKDEAQDTVRQEAPESEQAEPERARPEAEEEPEEAATTQEGRETAPGQGDRPGAEREDSSARATESAQEEAAARQEGPTAAPTPGQAPAQQPAQRKDSDGSDSGAYVTPLVRKLAAEHDVDLSSLTGSGVGGRIRKQDVLEAAKQKKEAPAQEQPAAAAEQQPAAQAPAVQPSPLRGKTEKMSRLRKVIAARMVESLQTSAQLTTVVEVDVTSVARLRSRKKDEFLQREGVKLSFTPFFAKAVVDSLKGHPKLNAAIDTDKGEITYYDAEHLGIAVDTERGLLVATVKDAGDLSIAGLARKIDDLGRRTRDNNVKPDELSGATFTLTNTGSRGALFDTPIINQPQVGILGTGAVVKRPVVIDDPNLGETIAVRYMCYFALTYDHRLVDGADAARFLSEVKQRLEHGQFDV
jgi:pyruvate dehydrogenase E2 component (dihydrolipoamide acetyltransferase)